MTDSTKAQQALEALLAEGVDAARKREAAAYDELTGGLGSRLVLFGAGNLGRRTLAGLRRLGIEPLCFVDNNTALWGEEVNGVRVMSPAEGAQQYGSDAVFLITVWCGEGTDRMANRVAQLRQLGCRCIVPFLALYWKHPGIFLPHFALDLPHHVHEEADEVRRAFQLFSDDDSRANYVEQVRWRVLGDFDCLPFPVAHAIYFPPDLFQLRSDESFVDCGAYDGDSLRTFLQQSSGAFSRVVAFEPDPENYRKLQDSVGQMPAPVRERIQLLDAATGDRRERVCMSIGGLSSSAVGAGDFEIDCLPLDEVLHAPTPTFIKMDIEGSEVATLRGAARILREQAPVLAVCLYHRQNDLWKIPLLIHSLNSSYSFHLRPHLLEGWDLVLYAVPPSRQLPAR
jgi:FkbM family methyltransferase